MRIRPYFCKNYYGSVHYNDDDEIFFGKLEFISSLVNYEGSTVKSLKKAFEEAVEDYLETCKSQKISPEEPFKGSFNVRTGTKLHKEAVVYAKQNKTNLNKVVTEALELYLASKA